MNNAADVKQFLINLVKMTSSPVYAACYEIAAYIELNPSQRDLTIGGLRAALKRSPQDDNILIQAAFTLAAHPFQAFEVRYRLYDEEISNVLEELETSKYLEAKSVGHFIDVEGNIIPIKELDSRVFPYFINKLEYNIESKPSFLMRVKL